MAERVFEIRTEPHVANIGGTRLLFQPEVNGAKFAHAYMVLKGTRDAITKAGDNVSAELLEEASTGLRVFIDTFLYDGDSRAAFGKLDLPDRVLVQLLEFTAELYGGGSGNDQGGSSGAS